MIKDVAGEDTLNVTLNGLRKFVWYSIQILAYTRMGDGRLSRQINERTDQDSKFWFKLFYIRCISN